MKILVDTHVILWWWAFPEKLSSPVLEAMVSAENKILVSAVSGYEIVYKHELGKLKLPLALIEEFEDAVGNEGWKSLALTIPHAVAAGKLETGHRDPFDRLLAAQSVLEGAVLATKDSAVQSIDGVAALW